MKNTIVCLFALLFALASFAAPTNLPPACPVPPPPPPAIPPECNITPEQTGWSGAIGCLNALVRDHGDTMFPGAVIGYQLDSQNLPRLYAAGKPGTGFETGDVTKIANLASVTKVLTFTALVKLVHDHMKSPDCADPANNPRCIFPNGFDSRLNIALLRLDLRNGTDNYSRWFTNQYIEQGARAQQDAWKKQDLRIRDLPLMTSGYPTLIFMGYKFCDGPDCAAPNEVVCPTNATSGECWYARLYNQYLENRGGASAPIPDTMRPHPQAGPRLFPFDTYYGGNVYAADRTGRKYWRRLIGEPYLFAEGVLQEDPATGARTWVEGRRATASDIAKFHLGLPLQLKPGTGYLYGQTNAYMAAFLIEQLTGIPFNAYVKRALFTPLGMNDTFYMPNRENPRYAVGGQLHYVVHGSTNPNDHSNDEGGTAAQFARVYDLKRIPRNVPRVIPDVAPGVFPAETTGPDLNWDEGRDGTMNAFPEGGAFTTGADMLRFLRFLRTGKAPNGVTLLDPAYLALITQNPSPISGRTYAFRSSTATPDILVGNGYWGTYVERDTNDCRNLTVLMQTIIDLPHAHPYNAQLCDEQYSDLLYLRGALINMLRTIPSTCQ